MGGVSQDYQAAEIATLAVKAGADVLLMPDNPEVAIKAIATAVKTGEISQARIEASVARIWQAKQRVSSHLSPDPLQDLATIAHPSALATAAAILRDAQTSNHQSIQPQEGGLSLIVVDDVFNCSELIARHTPAVAIPKQLGYQVQLSDSTSLPTKAQRPTILQVFARGNPFRGTAGLTPAAEQFYRQIIYSGHLQGLIVYGSPYVRDWLIEQLPNPETAWVFSYGQNPTAQAIAWQQMLELEINWQTQQFL
jgi:beta-glucosidase